MVISGLPGTGKSTVAQAVARHLEAVHLSIDPVEDAMLGAGVRATGVAAYEVVRVMAEQNLRLDRAVVVDAVNDSEAARQTWRRAALDAGVPLRFVLLVMNDGAAHRRRLEGRTCRFENVPEPTWEQAQARATRFEPWSGRSR
ncbi:MAG: AAA family ATPase [Myxococcales bacterium]|nr:AAA family ATPase [Myxococcales bacterium]